MDAVQLLRDMREMQEWLGVTEKAVTKFKITDKRGVQKTFHHVNINALLRRVQIEQNMVDRMKPVQNGFLGYLGLYILVVALVGLVSAGIAILYEKYYSSKTLAKLKEDNKDKRLTTF